MFLLKNGYVYDPASGLEGKKDILIEGKHIKRLAEPGELDRLQAAAGEKPTDKEIIHKEATDEEDLQILDIEGCQVAPGLVDVHVHFRDPGFTHKEDILTGAKAAAKGGFTTVVLMANTAPVVDNAETLRYVLDKGRETGIHVESCAAITKGLAGVQLTEMDKLVQAGAAGFTDDGIPLLQEDMVRAAMVQAAKLNVPVSLHEEDPAFIQNNGINAGKASAYFGIGGSDRQAEISLVERDVRLATETMAKVNIQHISTKEAVDLVREGKKKNPNLCAEATPHHFTLTEEAVIEHGTLAKMNPPLREEADRQAIIQGLKDGTISLIATDHAPHSAEEKAKELTKAPSGIIGLETALALGITTLVRTGFLTMQELLAKMTCNPARFYGLDAGSLREGGPADLVVFQAGKPFRVDSFVSKSANSPFTGQTLYGTVKYTICSGRLVYQEKGEH